MIKGLSHVTLIVKDQDEALKWYTEVLGLSVQADMQVGEHFRWLTVGADSQPDLQIVLHKPHLAHQEGFIGKQSIGVLNTDDCRGDIEKLRAKGARVILEPENQMWGVQAIIEDGEGNSLVLVQPAAH